MTTVARGSLNASSKVVAPPSSLHKPRQPIRVIDGRPFEGDAVMCPDDLGHPAGSMPPNRQLCGSFGSADHRHIELCCIAIHSHPHQMEGGGVRERAVTIANFGAWMVQCNPAVWDFDAFLRAGDGQIRAWSVRPGYRTELMEFGQQMLLWVAGQGGRYPEPGLWGTGIVTGRVQHEEPGKEPHLWLDEVRRQRSRHFIPIDVQLLPKPIPRHRLRADPRLSRMEVLRQPQMANPLLVTAAEITALEDQLDLPRLTVTVNTFGAGFGDAATRAKVEIAAMKAVSRHYRRRGWDVDDVSKSNLGWDLDCTSPHGDVHHVEVKGVSGASPTALLTRNESRAASTHPGWRLAIVTQALHHPQLHVVDGATAVDASTPFVHQVDLTSR